MRFAVFGAGPVGRAVALRMSDLGHDVVAGDRENCAALVASDSDVAILAVTHGAEAEEIVRRLQPPTSVVVDLTTSSPSASMRCHQAAQDRQISFHGGGLTGGANQVRSGSAIVLLGPPLPPGIADAIGALGEVYPFTTSASAARAKLSHNMVLLAHQTVLAATIAAQCRDDRHTFLRVLSSGTAGRPIEKTSLVRDLLSGVPSSSYSSRVTAKDLDLIQQEFPDVMPRLGPLLNDLSSILSVDDNRPFTASLMEAIHDSAPPCCTQSQHSA